MSPKLKKEKRKMTPEVKATDNATTVEKISVKRTLFNLDTFKRESKETEIVPPVPVKTLEEVLAAVGNDDSKIVQIYNAGAKRQAIKEAKMSMGGENLVSPKIISSLVSGFLAKFPLTYTGEDSAKSSAARSAQRESVYSYIRENPPIQNALKLIASTMTVDVEDEDGGDEATE